MSVNELVCVNWQETDNTLYLLRFFSSKGFVGNQKYDKTITNHCQHCPLNSAMPNKQLLDVNEHKRTVTDLVIASLKITSKVGVTIRDKIVWKASHVNMSAMFGHFPCCISKQGSNCKYARAGSHVHQYLNKQ